MVKSTVSKEKVTTSILISTRALSALVLIDPIEKKRKLLLSPPLALVLRKRNYFWGAWPGEEEEGQREEWGLKG